MVYIVLVNWNGWRDTLECLESLLRLAAGNFRIIVCDNGSTDGSLDQIANWSNGTLQVDLNGPPWARIGSTRRKEPALAIVDRSDARPEACAFITVIKIGENIGFAGANNVGAALALEDAAATHVWFLNNDTVVDPEVLNVFLARSAEDQRIGMCGASLLYYDTPDLVQGIGVEYNLLIGKGKTIGWMQRQDQLPSPDWVEKTTSYIIGASLFVSRAFLTDIGPMCEDYFLYFEELDWALRNAGRYRMVWAPGAIVYHKEGSAAGTSAGGRSRPTATYYQSVNLLRFVRKYRTVVLPVSLLKLLLVSGRYIIRRDAPNAKIVFLAIRDYFAGVYRRGAIS